MGTLEESTGKICFVVTNSPWLCWNE